MANSDYGTFDGDLRHGKLREDAFGRLLQEGRWEHKRDHWSHRSGNVAIEYKQKDRDGNVVLSGIATTTSVTWAVEFGNDQRLVLTTEYAKNLARMAIMDRRSKWIGDGGNHLNALVPLEWVWKYAPNDDDRGRL